MRRLLASLAVAGALLAACGPPKPSPSPTPSPSPVTTSASPSPSPAPSPSSAGGLLQIADEGKLTQSVTLHPGECHAVGQLPDPFCTPGSTDPAVTQATIGKTICVTGWTSTVRPPSGETTPFKYDVAYPAYGIAQGAASELDHLVPLELGGSNDATNLWPEAGSLPNPKDSVENDLRADVCAGEMSLAVAQNAIAADWQTAP